MSVRAVSRFENGSDFLQIAEFSPVSYANAIIVYLAKFGQNRIIIPSHVASGNPRLRSPDRSEGGNFTFWQVDQRDLAVSYEPLPGPGIFKIADAKINEQLLVCGHHGPDSSYFETLVQVVRVEGNRIVVKRLSGYEFVQGVSGSPGLNSRGELVGVIVRGHKTDPNEFYLEPASALLTANQP